MRCLWVPAGLLAALAAGSARAQDTPAPSDSPPNAAVSTTPPAGAPNPEADKTWDKTPASRRSGFTAGILAGLAFGTVHGYPNDFGKIDVPAYRSATSGVGSSFGLYLGGALTDWFTFALGIDISSFRGSQLVSRGSAFLFHLEAFPAMSRGGFWRDAGLFADFGTGVSTIRYRNNDNFNLATGGALSIVGLGAFFEPWRLGSHIALGPYASWHYQSSDSMARHVGAIGLRGAFYGGP
jgi:hypothetical protein